MVNFPRRLWVSTSNVHRFSDRDRGKKKMPYPREILIETDIANAVENVDDKAPQRPSKESNNGKEDAKYWKYKAVALKGALEKLEEKVTLLEQESEMWRGRPPLTRRSPDLPAPEQSSASNQSVPAIPNHELATPPPLPLPGLKEKEKAEKQKKERRNDVMKQLVSEMERLIEFHALKIVDEEEGRAKKGGGINDKGSDEDADDVKDSEEGAGAAKDPNQGAEAVKDPDMEGGASKDPAKMDGRKDVDKETIVTVDVNDSSNDTLPSRRNIKIDTVTLEDLVTKILATDSSKPHKSRKDKSKLQRKSKPQSVLYQLSCKKCIGQNFLGSTKRDLKDKVKENYGIVWQHVCTAYGRGGGDGPEEKDAKELEQNLSFRASSFAHHVATHCRKCESHEEVYNWCLESVKVERVSKQPMLSADRYDFGGR